MTPGQKAYEETKRHAVKPEHKIEVQKLAEEVMGLRHGWPKCCGATMSLGSPTPKNE